MRRRLVLLSLVIPRALAFRSIPLLAWLGGSGVIPLVAACSNTSPTTDSTDAAGGPDGAVEEAAPPLDAGVLPIGTVDAAGGEPCEASADCPSGLLCMYPLAQACGATGVCTVLAASLCGGPYCTCRGDTTAACGDFGKLPMEIPLHGPPCGAPDSSGAETGAPDAGQD